MAPRAVWRGGHAAWHQGMVTGEGLKGEEGVPERLQHGDRWGELDWRALKTSTPPTLHERLAVLVREERLHLEAHRQVEDRRPSPYTGPPALDRR